MSKLSTQPYKGTRDFYPADMRVRQWIFGKLRQTLATFGFEEYDGPMLEPFELYASKTSEEIVNEQLYWLTDRGDRKLAIRPEMTPTLARMVAGKQMELPKPIRWFSIPNLWRYERPQRGRLREHWQLNVDVFGGDPFLEDLELCQVIGAIMHGFGASSKHYEVRLNHRGLTNHLFQKILSLDTNQHASVGRLLDAAPKMGAKKFQENLEAEGLKQEQIQILLKIIDPKASTEDILTHLKTCNEYQYLLNILTELEPLGFKETFKIDFSIMRGFMYYTGMVLEVYDLHPDNNRALFGGGRYDDLVGMFGGNKLPGVGFGMGDVTLRNFLETHGLLPDLNQKSGLYIAHLSDETRGGAQKLAQHLRHLFQSSGETVRIITALKTEKLKKAFVTAEKLSARSVIFVGEDELKTQNYSMKDFVTGKKFDGTIELLAKSFLQLNSQ